MSRIVLTVALFLTFPTVELSRSGEVAGSTPVAKVTTPERDRVKTVLLSWPWAEQGVATEVADAIVRYSNDHSVPIELALAVMRVENPWLKPDTVSYAGAVGLFQVMPQYWDHEYAHCGEDLRNVQVNVCKGTAILAYYIERSESLESALLAYNGCRREACSSYATRVLTHYDDHRNAD